MPCMTYTLCSACPQLRIWCIADSLHRPIPTCPAGNEVHRALAECMPPAVTLQCLPVAWLPGGLVELEITGECCSGCILL